MRNKTKFVFWQVFKAIIALCIFLTPIGVASTLSLAESLQGYVIRLLIVGLGLPIALFLIRYIEKSVLLAKLETMLSIQGQKMDLNQSKDKQQ